MNPRAFVQTIPALASASLELKAAIQRAKQNAEERQKAGAVTE